MLVRAFHREGADRLLLLGDLLYHGPRNDLPREYAPKRVAELLNDLAGSVLCVRGNCDAEVDQAMLLFPILAEYAALFVGDRVIFATHGHRYNDDTLPPLKKGDILLTGHTHIPMCAETAGILCLNPGSVSIPKEDSPPRLHDAGGRPVRVEGFKRGKLEELRGSIGLFQGI